MALRDKEALEKFFAESRERVAKRKEREDRKRKNFNKWLKKRAEIEKRKEERWAKIFLSSIKNDSKWYEHWDDMDIAVHSVDILNELADKKEMNDIEKEVWNFTLALAYPNDFDI